MRLYDEEPGIDSMALLMFLRKVMDNRSLPGPSLLRLVLHVQYERDWLRTLTKEYQKLSQVRAFHFYNYFNFSPSSCAAPVKTTNPWSLRAWTVMTAQAGTCRWKGTFNCSK